MRRQYRSHRLFLRRLHQPSFTTFPLSPPLSLPHVAISTPQALFETVSFERRKPIRSLRHSVPGRKDSPHTHTRSAETGGEQGPHQQPDPSRCKSYSSQLHPSAHPDKMGCIMQQPPSSSGGAPRTAACPSSDRAWVFLRVWRPCGERGRTGEPPFLFSFLSLVTTWR